MMKKLLTFLLVFAVCCGLGAPAQAIFPHANGIHGASIHVSAASYTNSIQQVSITVAAASSSATATISTVGSNAFIIYQGIKVGGTNTSDFGDLAMVVLTNT